MHFDANAYAEGICNSAAGSTIEFLVDTIDSTVGWLDTHAEDIFITDDDDKAEREDLRRLSGLWSELREAIVEREKGEGTTFSDDNPDERYTVTKIEYGYEILDGGVPMEPRLTFKTKHKDEAEEEADKLNATE